VSVFQPTFADIRNQVMMKLRLADEDEDLVTYWMQQAYADAAQHAGFRWEKSSIFGLLPGSGAIDLPCGVAWIRSLTMIYPDGSRSYPAEQVRNEMVLSKQTLDDSGGPLQSGVVYAVSGQFSVVYWPLAIGGQQIELVHTVVPDALDDDDTPTLAEPYGSKILEYGALVEGAKFKKDPLMSDFEFSYRMWLDRYVGWLNRRKGGGSTAFEVWPSSAPVDRLALESEAWH
jgi:hypothetical protein